MTTGFAIFPLPGLQFDDKLHLTVVFDFGVLVLGGVSAVKIGIVFTVTSQGTILFDCVVAVVVVDDKNCTGELNLLGGVFIGKIRESPDGGRKSGLIRDSGTGTSFVAACRGLDFSGKKQNVFKYFQKSKKR